MKDNGDYNEDPTSNSIAEVEDDFYCDNAKKHLVNSSICPESKNFTPSKFVLFRKQSRPIKRRIWCLIRQENFQPTVVILWKT